MIGPPGSAGHYCFRRRCWPEVIGAALARPRAPHYLSSAVEGERAARPGHVPGRVDPPDDDLGRTGHAAAVRDRAAPADGAVVVVLHAVEVHLVADARLRIGVVGRLTPRQPRLPL